MPEHRTACHPTAAPALTPGVPPHRVLQLAQDATAYSNRGYAHRKLAQYEAAVEDYSAALLLTPGSARLHTNRAYCHAKLGLYSEAIHDYDQVLLHDAGNVHVLHNRCGRGYTTATALAQLHEETIALYGPVACAHLTCQSAASSAHKAGIPLCWRAARMHTVWQCLHSPP
jgi:tetratricopeptide (TPR) repeat protein